MTAWVIPALYPANPWTLGAPSTSGQLVKCGMGLSLRFRGEKPMEPWRGRCSFGIAAPPREGRLSAIAKGRGLDARPCRCLRAQKGQGRITGFLGGIARGRLVGATGRPYGRGLYNVLEGRVSEARPPVPAPAVRALSASRGCPRGITARGP